LNKQLLRKLPSVDALLSHPEAASLMETYGRQAVLDRARAVIDELRAKIQRDGPPSVAENDLALESVTSKIRLDLEARMAPSLRKVINATGVLMHSGLGRAVLAGEAVQALALVGEGYSNLAIDLETGRRGDRYSHVAGLLCELAGAEAAVVVNNNAAATVLILNTLAKGKEVIISRGQLVEIGGSFRMPEVMATSGAILREVGATNKTHLRDYETVISERTGALMRVHHSNYRIVGFAEEPGIGELVEIGRKHQVPVIDDLGSGALIDLKDYGLETEPLIQTSLAAGVDVACFSGDKLIGGPQSGIIVGRAAVVAQIKKNPLMRAFRVGKLTLAAMESTLKLFLNLEKINETHPLYRMLSLSLGAVERRAKKLAVRLLKALPEKAIFSAEDSGSQVGSGSVPVETIPTKVLAVRPQDISSDALARNLRLHKPPIFARVYKDYILFDLRTIQPEEDIVVEKAILKILGP